MRAKQNVSGKLVEGARYGEVNDVSMSLIEILFRLLCNAIRICIRNLVVQWATCIYMRWIKTVLNGIISEVYYEV